MLIVSSHPTVSCMSHVVAYRDDPECALHCTLQAPTSLLSVYLPIILTHMRMPAGWFVLNPVT